MKIVNFGQVVDLEHGTQIAHQFTVEIAPGHRVQVQTDERTVQQLVEALTGNGAPRPVVAPQRRTLGEMLAQEAPSPEVEDEGEYDASDVFGGDYDPGELAAVAAGSIAQEPEYEPEAVMGTMAEEPVAAPQAPQGGLGQKQQRPPRRPQIDGDGFFMPVKARTVPKDEMGYPIVQKKAVVQNVPQDDGSEDGTQI